MRFRPVAGQQLTPSGAKARVEANLAAIRLSRDLQAQGRPATPPEQQVLAAWSSWGAVPQAFDAKRDDFAGARSELTRLLTPAEFDDARRTTINAHYTDATIAAAMWATMGRLGQPAGDVLEPGCGSGTFIGLAPEGMRVTGVELDPITAGIARALYPHAEIRTESFADSHFRSAAFDAAIGNVPFADVVLHDRRHNAGRHSLHDHFIVKSLGLVRPGGLVVFLTSSFTMDRANPAARREMHGLADLLGAVRLPSGAHRRTAGTEVVTDLLVFRRREVDRTPGDDSWTLTQPRRIDDTVIRLNTYFDEHHDHILGRLTVGNGMYGAETVRVVGDLSSLPADLQHVLDEIADQAIAADLTAAPRPTQAAPPAAHLPSPGRWEGHIDAHEDGTFSVLTAAGDENLAVPRTQVAELRHLLTMRDLARDLLTAEAASVDDTDRITGMRADLHRQWTDYVGLYGPINRYTTVLGVDPKTGEPKTSRRTPPVMRHLTKDPFGPLVKALELFDDTTKTAAPASLLVERVVAPRPPVLGADTPSDALAITLDRYGRVDLDHVADLLGVDQDEARVRLGDLVFTDPVDGELRTRAEYLSGNVRAKLADARVAAAEHPEFAGNVTALQEVQPPDLTADEITPRIGAVWIPDTDHQDFLRLISGDQHAQVEYGGGTVWEVQGADRGIPAVSEWGTEDRPAGDIMHALLEQKTITITHKIDDEIVVDTEQTEAAREKAAAMQERFAEWIWEDPARTDRLVAEYNRRFNNLRLRDYTDEGERLTFPGLAKTFTPRPHQRAAVARMIHEPAVGLFHQVGAGKTAEMVMGAMELRRMGLVRKPAVVVPNHMLEQFTREWLQLYPTARVLAASSDDLAGDKRRQFVARAAANDWDTVVMTQGAFQRIRVSPDSMTDYLSSQLEIHRTRLETAREGGRDLTIKRLEKAVMRTEERLKALADLPRDPGVSWEQTGIDYIIVDEAHLYKNLVTITNIQDAAIEGSKRAEDLHMKLELLRRTHGGRVATLATATPIANSVSEAHVMQRYLRPDLLRDAGVEDFDAWAATFGETTTELEMRPGGAWKEKTRLARYRNVPELLTMFRVFADVKTAQDLNLPTPDLHQRPDGQRWPETVLVPQSAEVADLMAWIGREIEIPGGRDDPAKALKLYTAGRAGSLDIRLVRPNVDPQGPTKISAAADRIARIYHDTKDNQYLDATGQTSPTPGALQIVFCDQSTPGPGWNVYDELRSDLTRRGVPGDRIRFIHEAKNDVEKGRLFAAARAGQISVLLGSTAKMGVGTNVQARAVALHHLDCPWRPADLEQRDGRIMRQGNQNPEIQIIRYAVEGSFDTISYQIVERKQRLISQIMRGDLHSRDVEDIGDAQLSIAETKAIASGDPLVLEKAQADKEVERLERLAKAHAHGQRALDWKLQRAQAVRDQAEVDEPVLAAAVAQSVPTRGDAFRADLGRHSTTDRAEAAQHLAQLTTGATRGYGLHQPEDHGVIIRLGGHDITARHEPTTRNAPAWTFAIQNAPRTSITIPAADIGDARGLLTRLENRVAALPTILADVHNQRAGAAQDVEQARAQLGQPFKHTAALDEARTRQNDIRRRIADAASPEPASTVQEAAMHREDAREQRMEAVDQDRSDLSLDKAAQANRDLYPEEPAPPPHQDLTAEELRDRIDGAVDEVEQRNLHDEELRRLDVDIAGELTGQGWRDDEFAAGGPTDDETEVGL